MNNHQLSNSQPDMTLQPSASLVSLTYIIYALHLFSAIGGVLSSAFILTAFLTGWPSIIAVVLNYLKRADVAGTYLDSHFRWHIRTFWFALIWMLIAGFLVVTFIGIPFAFIIFVATGIWVLYRMIRGLLRLNKSLPMPFNQ
ncbi:MAG: putative membrane protein [Cellvibrionaceae bacterium]|jgi:uncharacterized membrane protein